jgi:hypothetical protein
MSEQEERLILAAWLQREWRGCCDTWKEGGPTYCYYCMCPPEVHALKRLLNHVSTLTASLASLEREQSRQQEALRALVVKLHERLEQCSLYGPADAVRDLMQQLMLRVLPAPPQPKESQ